MKWKDQLTYLIQIINTINVLKSNITFCCCLYFSLSKMKLFSDMYGMAMSFLICWQLIVVSFSQI